MGEHKRLRYTQNLQKYFFQKSERIELDKVTSETKILRRKPPCVVFPHICSLVFVQTVWVYFSPCEYNISVLREKVEVDWVICDTTEDHRGSVGEKRRENERKGEKRRQKEKKVEVDWVICDTTEDHRGSVGEKMREKERKGEKRREKLELLG